MKEILHHRAQSQGERLPLDRIGPRRAVCPHRGGTATAARLTDVVRSPGWRSGDRSPAPHASARRWLPPPAVPSHLRLALGRRRAPQGLWPHQRPSRGRPAETGPRRCASTALEPLVCRQSARDARAPARGGGSGGALARYDDNGNRRITCKEVRRQRHRARSPEPCRLSLHAGRRWRRHRGAQGDAGDALKTIEVTLLDQIIVTSTAVLSFRTKGLL